MVRPASSTAAAAGLLFMATASGLAAAGRFTCTVARPASPAANVTRLHPTDIGFTIALGDSITAAFAARSTLLEDRDISWCIGKGSDDNLTLPHILGYYSPLVQGMSTEAVIPGGVTHLPHGDYHPLTDHLNVAESEGSVERNSMVEQWELLMGQIGKYPTFPNAWKVVTIWMTANDVCDKCHPGQPSVQDLDFWAATHDQVIANITSTMKNVYINLVSTLDLSSIARVQRTSALCSIEHRVILQECGCVDRGNKTELAALDRTVHTYNDRLHQLARDWAVKLEQMGRSGDVAVVVQPFQENVGDALDLSFLNTLDCFHPAAKAHEDLAVGLWNSMLCGGPGSAGSRHDNCGMGFDPAAFNVTCPTADSFFYTGPDVTPDPPPHPASRFDCEIVKPETPAANVTRLHPTDIGFTIALGDSITAAFAARSTLLEDRDLSWAIGEGHDNQLTLPHLLGYYSKSVQGMSTTAVLPAGIAHLPHGDYHPDTDHLNVAESEGAVGRNSMVEQWELLQGQIGKYPTFKDAWKVVTIWMTANDVCDKCQPGDPTTHALESWAAGHDAVLANITSTMKNVYINLVSTLDLSNVARLQRESAVCSIEHRVLLKECGCIDRGNKTELEALDRSVHAYNNRLHQLASDWGVKIAAMNRTADVAVVVQAFQEGVGPQLDLSFLNTLDCFHPSAKAHEDLGIGLWNSMLCGGDGGGAADRKRRCGEGFDPANFSVTCPTADSFFYTGPDVTPDPPTA
jgi:hypothetical protein